MVRLEVGKDTKLKTRKVVHCIHGIDDMLCGPYQSRCDRIVPYLVRRLPVVAFSIISQFPNFMCVSVSRVLNTGNPKKPSTIPMLLSEFCW